MRMIHVTDLLSKWRNCTVSNADLEPPMTTTFVLDGEVRKGMLAARERVWKVGRFGVEVRPVAIRSFRR